MSENNITKILIATDFTDHTGARYRSDGDHSGQEFYEDLLKVKFEPIFQATGQYLLIDLDGTFGYASSFISEVFRRLVLDFKDKEKIKAKLQFKSEEDPLLIKAILNIIDETNPDENQA